MLVILKRDDEEISLQAARLSPPRCVKNRHWCLDWLLAAPWSESTNISCFTPTKRARFLSRHNLQSR